MPALRFAKFFALLLLLVSCPTPALCQSQIVDLGVLPGDNYCEPQALNNAGQVVGFCTAEGDLHADAFVWSNGVMTRIPLSGYVDNARAINDSGEVVGSSGKYAFLYSEGQLYNLGSLGEGSASAKGINNTGEIVGLALVRSPDFFHPFVYRAGKMVEIQPPTGHGHVTYAAGINDAGQIAGWSYLWNSTVPQAFVDNGEGPVAITANLGATYTRTAAINQLGQITGTGAKAGSGEEAFLYTNGQMADLGDVGATGINDFGEVVGMAGGSQPVLFRNGARINVNSLLPDSDWGELSVIAINDAEQMIGTGVRNRRSRHAYLLSTNLPPRIWKYNATIVGGNEYEFTYGTAFASTPTAFSRIHNRATGSFTPNCGCSASYMDRNGFFTTDVDLPGVLGNAIFNAVNSPGIFVGQTEKGYPIGYPIDHLPTVLVNQPGVAWDVNDAGLIAGVVYSGPNQTDPSGFLWNAGEITSLDSFLPRFINATGKMLGTVSGSVAIYSNGAATVIGNPPGSYTSFALKAFSDSGNFLVSTTSGTTSTSFVYKNGAYEQLPSGFAAAGLNSAGFMVGRLGTVPVLYVNGVFTPVDTLIEGMADWPKGAYLSDVVAINNSEQLLGTITDEGNIFGKQISVILTPIPNTP